MTTINRQLNLVIPVEREDELLYVHSSPITYETFERFHKVLSAAYAQIFTNGLAGALGAPKIAHLTLKSVALETARPLVNGSWWEGPDGVEQGLMQEIIRLSNVLQPKEGGGWQVLPLSDALRRSAFNQEEVGSILGQAVFFTLLWRMAPLGERSGLAQGGAAIGGSGTTSFNATEYATSLMTSPAEEPTGQSAQEAEKVLLIPH